MYFILNFINIVFFGIAILIGFIIGFVVAKKRVTNIYKVVIDNKNNIITPESILCNLNREIKKEINNIKSSRPGIGY